MSGYIPVVDFSAYGLDIFDINVVNKKTLNDLALVINQAFSHVGFCYLKNHGIPDSMINGVFTASKKFFNQGIETKQNFSKPIDESHGWVSLEQESVNPDRPGDLKEAYNFVRYETRLRNCPDVAYFRQSLEAFFDKCAALSMRIFDVMSIGLNLKEVDFLRNCHALMGSKGNHTTLRSLLYPELFSNTEIKSGQLRCGEHTDYGTLTLLFQDQVGGLEVKTCEGKYVPASPIPGTVLVNIGDMMQRWTADKLIATEHRVLLTKEEIKKRQSRQSLAFFVHPDDEVMIKCLDGSEKYNPISSINYLNQRLAATY